jgi:uncharacterized protein YbjT (DUF2867 family)
MPSPLGRDVVGTELIEADVHDEASVAAVLAGAYGVVNAVSLYVERGGRETFHAVHVVAAARIARLAREAGVERLVHVSASVQIQHRPRTTSAPAVKARRSSRRPSQPRRS